MPGGVAASCEAHAAPGRQPREPAGILSHQYCRGDEIIGRDHGHDRIWISSPPGGRHMARGQRRGHLWHPPLDPVRRGLQHTATASPSRATAYAIALGWPGERAVITSLGTGAGKVESVDTLGNPGPLEFTQDAEGLKVKMPARQPCRYASPSRSTVSRSIPPGSRYRRNPRASPDRRRPLRTVSRVGSRTMCTTGSGIRSSLGYLTPAEFELQWPRGREEWPCNHEGPKPMASGCSVHSEVRLLPRESLSMDVPTRTTNSGFPPDLSCIEDQSGAHDNRRGPQCPVAVGGRGLGSRLPALPQPHRAGQPPAGEWSAPRAARPSGVEAEADRDLDGAVAAGSWAGSSSSRPSARGLRHGLQGPRPELDRIVAVKVPRAGNLADGEERDRFLREAAQRPPSCGTRHRAGARGRPGGRAALPGQRLRRRA